MDAFLYTYSTGQIDICFFCSIGYRDASLHVCTTHYSNSCSTESTPDEYSTVQTLFFCIQYCIHATRCLQHRLHRHLFLCLQNWLQRCFFHTCSTDIQTSVLVPILLVTQFSLVLPLTLAPQMPVFVFIVLVIQMPLYMSVTLAMQTPVLIFLVLAMQSFTSCVQHCLCTLVISCLCLCIQYWLLQRCTLSYKRSSLHACIIVCVTHAVQTHVSSKGSRDISLCLQQWLCVCVCALTRACVCGYVRACMYVLLLLGILLVIGTPPTMPVTLGIQFSVLITVVLAVLMPPFLSVALGTQTPILMPVVLATWTPLLTSSTEYTALFSCLLQCWPQTLLSSCLLHSPCRSLFLSLEDFQLCLCKGLSGILQIKQS